MAASNHQRKANDFSFQIHVITVPVSWPNHSTVNVTKGRQIGWICAGYVSKHSRRGWATGTLQPLPASLQPATARLWLPPPCMLSGSMFSSGRRSMLHGGLLHYTGHVLSSKLSVGWFPGKALPLSCKLNRALSCPQILRCAVGSKALARAFFSTKRDVYLDTCWASNGGSHATLLSPANPCVICKIVSC